MQSRLKHEKQKKCLTLIVHSLGENSNIQDMQK